MAANTYNPRVLIHNWSEDIELEQTRLRDFLDRKARGELGGDPRGVSMREVALSVSPDGTLRVGMYVLLLSERTGGFLSVDIRDPISHSAAPAFGTTTSHTEASYARNAFQIVRAVESAQGDDVIRYGDRLRFLTHETLSENPLFLHSNLKSQVSYSRKMRHQELYVSGKPTWDTAWEILHYDPLLRFEAEGTAVPSNTRVVIRHCSTHAALASDTVPYMTSFGEEFETCTHNFINTHKAEMSQNHWVLVTSTDAPEGMGDRPEDTTGGAAVWA